SPGRSRVRRARVRDPRYGPGSRDLDGPGRSATCAGRRARDDAHRRHRQPRHRPRGRFLQPEGASVMSSEFTAVLPTGKPARKRGSVVVRALRNPAGLVAGVVIAIVFAVAVLADVIAPYGAQESDLSRLFEHGGDGHLLGTDGAGRDVLSLLIYGARSSLIGAAIAVGVSMLVGIPTGLIAGFYGRWFDQIGTWISSAILALPGIVVLLAFRASVSTSMWAAMLVFGVLLAPSFFTLVRAAVRSVRNE